jgi:probable HAF family extracellular repeat protein
MRRKQLIRQAGIVVVAPLLFGGAARAGETEPVAPPPARIPTYTVRDLGVLEGYTDAWPRDLNDLGQAVGFSRRIIIDGGLQIQDTACLFDNGEVFSLGLSPINSQATAINNHGLIVGTEFETFGWLWEEGQVTWLGSLTPGSGSGPTDINDLGQVVGWSSVPLPDYKHAFLWENGVMTDLGTLPGDYRYWEATAINDVSQIVGIYEESDPLYRKHAFVWENGVITELPGVKRVHTVVTDINHLGHAVGNSGSCARIWIDGQLECLAELPSSLGGAPMALNDHGQVTGSGSASTQPPTTKAVIWHRRIRYDLQRLAAPNTSFDLISGEDINNAGQVLCRAGCSAMWGHCAILLTPINCDDDDDGQVTLSDFSSLPGCMSGPQGTTDPLCVATDFDGDGDVDMVDYRSLELAIDATKP